MQWLRNGSGGGGVTAWAVALAVCAGVAGSCRQKAESPDVGVTPIREGEELERRQLEIGFAVGYLGTTVSIEDVLERISADGFRVVRAYEPFSQYDDSSHSGIKERLRALVDNGLTPYLSLSNFPPALLPNSSQQNQLGARYPAKKRADVLKYSNRYAPRDRNAYQASVRHLIEELASEFGREELRRWYFEIGNEPDAPLYFWGSPQDFREIFSLAAGTLKNFDPQIRVAVGGFTSGLVADSTGNIVYYRLARDLAASPLADFASFHVYANLFGESLSRQAISAFGGDAKTKIVSEWNVSTVANRRTESILTSEQFMGFLIDAVAASYDAGVELLLVHKLVDLASKGQYQLGIFDREGQPKQAYRYLRLMNEVVRSGFSAEVSPGLVVIRSDDAVVAMSKGGEVPFDYAGLEVVESSGDVNPRDSVLRGGEWVLLRSGN